MTYRRGPTFMLGRTAPDRIADGIRRRSALLLLAAVPAACAVPYWTNHTLTPVVGPVTTAAPRTIAVMPVHLPQYLMRTEIVRSSETAQPEILPWDWWADALWILIGRTTVQNLTQRLPGSIVYTDTGAVTAQPGASVEITIERFDTTLAGLVLLQAQVVVSVQTSQSRNVLYSARPADSSVASLVYAMSLTLAQMANLLAAVLSESGPRDGNPG